MKKAIQALESGAIEDIKFQKELSKEVSRKKPLARKIVRLDDYEFQCVFGKTKSLGSVSEVLKAIRLGGYTFDVKVY